MGERSERRTFTVTVHKTNTDPLVFSDVTAVNMTPVGVIVTSVRSEGDQEWEHSVSVRAFVITRVTIEPSASGSSEVPRGTEG